MEELICLFFGHDPEFRTRKQWRFTRWGETGTQYETVLDTYCARCHKMQSPLTGQYLGV